MSWKTASLCCGVPQGSILGPVIFSVYLLPSCQIAKKYDISLHCCADDTELNLPPLKLNERSILISLMNCPGDIKCWMALKLATVE